ncbi:MAG: [Clostridia bacterium]|nr:[citrate (pro-3S)-lyase] ligase [Clostridia bacterium]
MHIVTGSPLYGIMLEKLQTFLHSCELGYDAGIQYTVLFTENDEIIATGSLDGNTIKCVAVSPAHQGEDLTAQVVTQLMQEAVRRSINHLFIYTKPQNQYYFAPLGFHPLMRTADCLLMENRRSGLQQYLENLKQPVFTEGPIGCIIANCNPFTKGHRYLVETASRECAYVHLFILSENKSTFSPSDRLCMAQEGCKDLSNVLVHPSGSYMISASTFPDYFLKDKSKAASAHCEMDIRMFAEKIAPALKITRRYVGTEPCCPVTAEYNRQLKLLLPRYGIELIEVERLAQDQNAISASKVRALLESGADISSLTGLLPPSTLKFLKQII